MAKVKKTLRVLDVWVLFGCNIGTFNKLWFVATLFSPEACALANCKEEIS